MKVVILHSSFELKGGAEAYIQQLRMDLSYEGSESVVICGEDVGIKHHKRSDHRIKRYKFQLLDIFGLQNKKLLDLIDSFSPDIIHINNWARLRSSTIYSISKKYPTIHTVHDFYLIDPSGLCNDQYPKFMRLLIDLRSRYLIYKFRKLNFHFPAERTKSIFETYSGLLPTKFTIYPLNLNFPESKYTPPRSLKNLGYLGQIEKHKGILDFALRGISLFQGSLQLHIAGDGSQLANVLELQSRANIIYHGWLDTKGKDAFFENIAWLVFTSEWAENFPLVCCEALSKGRPIIVAEKCIPPMANPDALLVYGENSKFRSVDDVLSFVREMSDKEYRQYSNAALKSKVNFHDTVSRNATYAYTISSFKSKNDK